MKRASEDQVREVGKKLMKHILSGDRAEMRDVYCVGMTHTITQVPGQFGASLVASVLPDLLTGCKREDAGMQRDCLQVATELLKRFGDKAADQHAAAKGVFLSAMASDAADVRKRASTALGQLAQNLADDLLQELITSLLGQLKRGSDAELKRGAISTISAVSRTVGYRLGRHLAAIVPELMAAIGSKDDDELMDDQGNELREACFQALESFVLRCPAEVTGHLDALRTAALSFLDFDPNFDYDAVDSEDEYDDDDEEDYVVEDDYGGYDDGEEDDDTTWKVRRGAVAVLRGIINTRSERLSEMYETAAGAMVRQFRERESTVRVDVFEAFTDLLKATVVLEGSAAKRTAAAKQADSEGDVPLAPPPMLQPAPLVRQRSAGPTLNAMVPEVVTAAVRVIEKADARDVKTRQAALVLLRQLVQATGDNMVQEMSAVLGVVAPSIKDSNANVRLAALLLLRQLPDCVPAKAFAQHMGVVTSITVNALGDAWFKAVSEALRVAGRVAILMHNTGSKDAAGVQALFDAMLPKLASSDVDQEIKEMAITSMGLLVSHLGDVLGARVHETYPMFLTRLSADSTRVASLKAIAYICDSPLDLDMGSVAAPSGGTVLEAVVSECVDLLRQASWQLCHATMVTLVALMKTYGGQLSPAVVSSLLQALSAVVGSSDLNLAQTALRLATVTMHYVPSSVGDVRSKIVDTAKGLVTSPALQGSALATSRAFFEKLVTVDTSLDAGALVSELQGLATAPSAGAGAAAAGDSSVQKQTVSNLAKVSASVICAKGGPVAATAVADMLAVAGNSAASDVSRTLALLTLADVGAHMDVVQLQQGALDTIQGAFTAGKEDIKSAAAAAFGGVAVGSPATGLPALFSTLSASGTAGGYYLTLTSLLEVLQRHAPATPGGPNFAPHVATVLPVLAQRAQTEDEGERAQAAECLGLLVGVQPAAGLEALSSLVASGDANARWTGVTAVKSCLHSAPATQALSAPGAIAPYMALLKDEDLLVRLAAMQTLHALVHSAPDIVRHLFLPSAGSTVSGAATGADGSQPTGSVAEIGIMPVLCYEMQAHPELQRQVDVGPFKVDVDDGEALRKAAFATADSVVMHLRERVTEVVMERVLAGLQDIDDVKLLAHQLLIKLAHFASTAPLVLGFLKAICEGLIATITKASKASDKSGGGAEITRSALRAIHGIDKDIPDARATREFLQLVQACETQEPLSSMLAQIRSEGALDHV